MQSLKKLFANNTAQQGSSSSRAAMRPEDEDIEMDPEYAPKRALTTKVRQQPAVSATPSAHIVCTCRSFVLADLLYLRTRGNTYMILLLNGQSPLCSEE